MDALLGNKKIPGNNSHDTINKQWGFININKTTNNPPEELSHKIVDKDKMKNSLTIEIGRGGYFEVLTSKSAHLNRLISIALENKHNDILTNCKVYIDEIFSSDIKIARRLLREGITLKPRGKEYINVAHYNEGTDHEQNNQVIIICGPPSPAYGGNVVRLPKGSYRITLRATCVGSDDFVVYCHLWIDEKGKLRLENI